MLVPVQPHNSFATCPNVSSPTLPHWYFLRRRYSHRARSDLHHHVPLIAPQLPVYMSRAGRQLDNKVQRESGQNLLIFASRCPSRFFCGNSSNSSLCCDHPLRKPTYIIDNTWSLPRPGVFQFFSFTDYWTEVPIIAVWFSLSVLSVSLIYSGSAVCVRTSSTPDVNPTSSSVWEGGA